MTNTNFSVNRSVINYIHARDYFPKDEVEQLRPLVQDVHWVDKKFGKEMAHFNLIFNDIDLVIGKMVGDIVEIDRPSSGTLRRTINEVIHFEDFEDLNDWRFVVSLEENEFKTYIHKEGYKTSIKMKPNDVLFYRPWIFHSFQDGILHYYKLKVL